MVGSRVSLFVLLFFLSKLAYAFSVSNLPSTVGVNKHFTISWTRNDDDPKRWKFQKETKVFVASIPTLPITVTDPSELSGKVDASFKLPGLFTLNAVSLDPPFNVFFTSDSINVKPFGGLAFNGGDSGQDSGQDAGNGEGTDDNNDGSDEGKGGGGAGANNNAGAVGSNGTSEVISPSSSSTSSDTSKTSSSNGNAATSSKPISSQAKSSGTSFSNSTADTQSSQSSTVVPSTATDSNDISSSGSASATDISRVPSPEATATSSTGTLPSATQPATNQQDNGQAPSKRPAIIAASIIGAIIFISLLVFFYLLYNRRRKRLLAQRERMMESFSFERDMEELRESAFRGIDRSGNDGGLGAGGAFMVPGISILGSSNAMNAQEGRGGLNGRWKSLKSSISRTFTLTTISSGPVTGSMFYGSRRESPGSEPDESWRRTSYFPSS